MLNKSIKKFWWLLLSIIYLFVLLYRMLVLATGLTTAELGLIIALLQTIIQNWHIANRLLLRLYFFIMNLQFRWRYTAQFKAPIEAIKKIDDTFLKGIVSEVLHENSALRKLKEDINVFYDSSPSPKMLITFMPLGVNICITKDYGSNGDNIGENFDRNTLSEYMYLKVVGDTQIKYRTMKKLLDYFLSSLFSKIEDRLPSIIHKKFTLEITSVEADSEYFKQLFIKGMEREDINKFSIEKRPGRFVINASDKRIYVSSEYREDIVNTANNMLFKLSL